jgi:hypothetical protein
MNWGQSIASALIPNQSVNLPAVRTLPTIRCSSAESLPEVASVRSARSPAVLISSYAWIAATTVEAVMSTLEACSRMCSNAASPNRERATISGGSAQFWAQGTESNIRTVRKSLVRKRGLEPLWVTPPDPKSGASANFATSALLYCTLIAKFQHPTHCVSCSRTASACGTIVIRPTFLPSGEARMQST